MLLFPRIGRALRSSAPPPLCREPAAEHRLQPLEPRLLLAGDIPAAFADAVVVPLTNSPVVVADDVSRANITDLYRIDLDEKTDLTLTRNGLSANADLNLFDSAGNYLERSRGRRARPETITRTFEPGTYFIRVDSVRGAATNYNLNFAFQPNAGAAASTARDLGVITTPVNVTDALDRRNRVDVYQFEIDETSNVTIALTGLSSNAGLQLLDADGHLIEKVNRRGSRDETIVRRLEAGTYFVRVIGKRRPNTTYNLNVSASPEVGATLAAASDLGIVVLPIAVANRVDNHDRIDVYRFTILAESNVTAGLTGLSANADLQLLDADGNLLQRAERPGIKPDTITRRLKAGTYFLRIIRQDTAQTNYTLNLNAVVV